MLPTLDTLALVGINHLHVYLLTLRILEKELDPGFAIIRGAFKLGELVPPQNNLGKDQTDEPGKPSKGPWRAVSNALPRWRLPLKDLLNRRSLIRNRW